MKIQLYDANSIQPTELVDDEPMEVGVIIHNQHYTGYWEGNNWWIDFNGITVGHRQVDWSEIDHWYYLGVYEDES